MNGVLTVFSDEHLRGGKGGEAGVFAASWEADLRAGMGYDRGHHYAAGQGR